MRDSNTERIGVQSVGLIITRDLKWIFREQPLVDVGIDAFIEEVQSGNPTGKFIAVQIKTGRGNFHENSEHLILYVSKIHYNYWLNTNIPVILVAHIPDNEKTFWEHINENTFEKTKKQWKLKIPKNKNLDKSSITDLSAILNNEKVKTLDEKELSNEEKENLRLEALKFGDATMNLMQILAYLDKVKKGTISCREKLEKYVSLGLTDKDPRVKKSMKVFGQLIEQICWKLNKEIDLFAQNFSTGIRAYEILVINEYKFKNDEIILEETLIALNEIIPNIDDSLDELYYLEEAIHGLPKNYTHLKKSRNQFMEVNGQLIKEFKVAKNMTTSFVTSLKNIRK